MTKVFSKVAIDYSEGIVLNKNGELVPNKVGCLVDDLKTAREFARRWKSD